MKKLIVILIIVLLGIFLLNAAQMQMTATTYPEQTMGYVFGIFNNNYQAFTSAERNLLLSRCGEQDIQDAATLIKLWGALLRVSTESARIMQYI